MPDGDGLVYSMAGSLWRQQDRRAERRSRADARGRRLRLSAGRRAGRRQRGVHPLRRQVDRVVVARSREPARTAADRERRRQRRAAHVAGRPADRVRLDRRDRALQPEDRGPHAARAWQTSASWSRRARAAIDRYYYSTHDHWINPSWSPDGQRVWFVTQRGDPLGHGLDLLDRVADAASRQVDCEPASARNLVGARVPRSGRTASASCSPITTAGSGTSSG